MMIRSFNIYNTRFEKLLSRKARFALKCLALSCAVLLAGSCNHHDEVPKDIMPVQKMSNLLLDMQMADAYNENIYVDTMETPEIRQRRLKGFYMQILQLHHTDERSFKKSYHYYESRPDMMQKVYQRMQDSIDVKIKYIDTANAAPPIK